MGITHVCVCVCVCVCVQVAADAFLMIYLLDAASFLPGCEACSVAEVRGDVQEIKQKVLHVSA